MRRAPRRPVKEVFDYVADERHEPDFNSRMSRVNLLTPEPIGAGSRFEIEMTMMRRVFDMTVEFTVFKRPRLLGSTSRSLPREGKGRSLLIAGSLTFDPVPEGTRMRWSWQVETPGAMQLLYPSVRRRRVGSVVVARADHCPPTVLDRSQRDLPVWRGMRAAWLLEGQSGRRWVAGEFESALRYQGRLRCSRFVVLVTGSVTCLRSMT
jgi:hypothetical protein